MTILNDDIELYTQMLEKSISSNEDGNSQNNENVATCYSNLGVAYQDAGDAKNALECKLKALAILEKLANGKKSGKQQLESEQMADTFLNLSIAYRALGDSRNAIDYANKAYAIRSKRGEKSTVSLARTLNSLGEAYQISGDNKKALDFYSKAHETAKSIANPVDSKKELAISFINLANAYHSMGFYSQSIDNCLNSLDLNESLAASPHVLSKLLNSLGLSLNELNSISTATLDKLANIVDALVDESIKSSVDEALKEKKSLFSNKIKYYSLLCVLKALEIRRSLYRQDHPDLAYSLSSVGLVYLKLGESKKSLEYSLESHKMYSNLYKDNHPFISNSLNNIGLAYQKLGDDKKSLEYLIRAYEISKKVKGNNHPDVAINLFNIGFAYLRLGKMQKAIENSLKSVEIYESIDKSHINLGMFYFNLAGILETNQEMKKSLDFRLKALQIYKKFYPDDHPEVASLLNSISITYGKLGDSTNALDYSLSALKMYKHIYNDHKSVVTLLFNVGYSYKTNGNPIKSIEYFLEGIDMNNRLKAEETIELAFSLNIIGAAYKDLGNTKKALEYCTRALLTYQNIYKGNHQSIVTSLNNVAYFYKALNRPDKALENYLKALAMTEKLDEQNKLETAILNLNIGSLYQKNKNEYQKALDHYIKANELLNQLDVDIQVLSNLLNSISQVYINLGDYAKAEEHALKILNIQTKFNGSKRDLSETHETLGDLYKQKGDIGKSIENMQKAYELRKSFYKTTANPEMISLIKKLADLHKQNNNDTKKANKYMLEEINSYAMILKDHSNSDHDNHEKIAAENILDDENSNKNENNKNSSNNSDYGAKLIECLSNCEESLITNLQKADLYYIIADSYLNSQPVKSVDYGLKALELYENLQQTTGKESAKSSLSLVKANRLLASAYLNIDRPNKSIVYSFKALNLNKLLDKKDNKELHLALTLEKLGDSFFAFNDLNKSFENYTQSLEILKTLPSSKVNELTKALVMEKLGLVQTRQFDFDQAITSYLDSLKIYNRQQLTGDDQLQDESSSAVHNLGKLAYALNNVACGFVDVKQCDKSIDYYLRSLEIVEKLARIGNDEEASVDLFKLNHNLAHAYRKLGSKDKEIEHESKKEVLSLQIFNSSSESNLKSLDQVGPTYRLTNRKIDFSSISNENVPVIATSNKQYTF